MDHQVVKYDLLVPVLVITGAWCLSTGLIMPTHGLCDIHIVDAATTLDHPQLGHPLAVSVTPFHHKAGVVKSLFGEKGVAHNLPGPQLPTS